jgi:molecular chaperone GrpE
MKKDTKKTDDSDEQKVMPDVSEGNGADKSPVSEEKAERKTDPVSKLKEVVDGKVKKAKKAKAKKKAAAEPIELQLLRLRADFDNFRKRTVRERSELYQRANEDLMEEILPVIDHIELALHSADEHGEDDAFVHGVKMVAEQLQSVLGRFGLKPIDAEGADFDHNLHEAISYLPSEDVPANKIVAQTRRGYLLGSKLLRATQVVVSGGASVNAEGGE